MPHHHPGPTTLPAFRSRAEPRGRDLLGDAAFGGVGLWRRQLLRRVAASELGLDVRLGHLDRLWFAGKIYLVAPPLLVLDGRGPHAAGIQSPGVQVQLLYHWCDAYT